MPLPSMALIRSYRALKREAIYPEEIAMAAITLVAWWNMVLLIT